MSRGPSSVTATTASSGALSGGQPLPLTLTPLTLYPIAMTLPGSLALWDCSTWGLALRKRTGQGQDCHRQPQGVEVGGEHPSHSLPSLLHPLPAVHSSARLCLAGSRTQKLASLSPCWPAP